MDGPYAHISTFRGVRWGTAAKVHIAVHHPLGGDTHLEFQQAVSDLLPRPIKSDRGFRSRFSFLTLRGAVYSGLLRSLYPADSLSVASEFSGPRPERRRPERRA